MGFKAPYRQGFSDINKVTMADRIRRSMINRVQLYFNCPEKTGRISRLHERTDRSDVVMVVLTRNDIGRQAGRQAGNTLFKINKKEQASPINSGLISMRGVLNIKNV
jgi:hypothetical protein